MTPDEYWNADPELARAYYEAERFRVRRKNTEIWYGGIYLRRAIVSSLSGDVAYFDQPISLSEAEAREQEEQRTARDQERAKQRFLSWYNGNTKEASSDEH